MGFEIEFLAVGKESNSGDAIVLRYGDLHGYQYRVVVIDGGFKENGEAIVDMLDSHYKTDRVDLVVSTHPDSDHCSGLQVVLENVSVGCLWMHQPWKHSAGIAKYFKDGRVTDNSISLKLQKSLNNARNLESAAINRGVPIVEPFCGTRFDPYLRVVGPEKRFYQELLPGFRGTPEPKSFGNTMMKSLEKFGDTAQRYVERWFGTETLGDDGETSAENNSSTMLMLSVDDHHSLLTADAGIPALTSALDSLDEEGFDYRGKLAFVQVPHHGSRRNVGPAVLDRLLGVKHGDNRQRSAYVSAAKKGQPKHPSQRVINAFIRRNASVYATQGQALCHYSNSPRVWSLGQATPLSYKEDFVE